MRYRAKAQGVLCVVVVEIQGFGFLAWQIEYKRKAGVRPAVGLGAWEFRRDLPTW